MRTANGRVFLIVGQTTPFRLLEEAGREWLQRHLNLTVGSSLINMYMEEMYENGSWHLPSLNYALFANYQIPRPTGCGTATDRNKPSFGTP
jgi:hypothetical protein